MPLIPYSEFTEPGGRLPSSNPASGVLNPLLDAYCAFNQPIEDFYRDTLNRAIPGAGDIYTAPGRAINGLICPSAPPPRDLPYSAPPLFPLDTRCPSRGVAEGVRYLIQAGVWTQFSIYGETWECGDNRGWPISPVRLYPQTGAGFYLGCECVRSDGSTYIQGFTPAAPQDANNRIVILQSTFLPCPGCDPTPTRPRLPGLPERPILPEPPVPPQIPVNIELPQLPGFPPINFPAIYIPITPQIDINAPITLAPRIDISPDFNFAPKIEIGLGGISIEGGGYPEPVPDVIEIITEGGGDCPDPCEPVDYNLIRDIAIQELDAKFPPARPFQEQTETFAAADSGTIGLPNFARWVRIEIVEPPRNVREQEGNPEAPNVFYNGWFSFGMRDSAGERLPIQYNLMSVPVPNNADFFSYTIIGLGTARITVGFDIAI